MLFLYLCLKSHGEASTQLFKAISRIQQFLLAEAVSYQLQANRQAFGIHCHRNTDSRESCQIHSRGINIAEIHFQRILKTLSDLRSRSRGSRSQDHVIFVKSIIKGFFDQGLCTKGFQIICIVITGA